MSVKASYSTPIFHVAEIERSIRFYELLGFSTVDTDRCQPLGWARLHCEGGAVMFLRTEPEHPVDAAAQAVSLVMYTPDLPALREQLLAHGIAAPPIRYPDYLPSGEIGLTDPDGYMVNVVHWGKSEHEAWEKRIGVKT
ncbi:MAG: VOC family protein [Terriglobales bacterium]